MRRTARNQKWDDGALRRAFAEARSLPEWPGHRYVAAIYNAETGQHRGAQATAVACAFRRLMVQSANQGVPWREDILRRAFADADALADWPGWDTVTERYNAETGQHRSRRVVATRAIGLGLKAGRRTPVPEHDWDRQALADAHAEASRDGIWRGWQFATERYIEKTGQRRTHKEIRNNAYRIFGLHAGTSEARA